jgi:polyisoprenyl-phosphate glycosyltransferase
MVANDKKVSVVLSFYNEENVLSELIQRLRTVFHQLISQKRIESYELIFVNDCSKDNSVQVIKNHMGNGDIVLVNMTRNFGVSECVMAGFRQATGDAVVYMDADLQDPPEVILEMISRWQDEDAVDVVYTTRRKRAGESPLKLWITKWGYRLINKISDIELPVDSGDFKLLSRRVVNQLIQLKEDKPYIRGLVSWVGYKQVQVMYDRDPRFDGRENTKMPVLSRKVIYYWLDRALISFSDAPLKIILFMGFLISGISLAYLSVILIQKIMGWYTPGWPALMSAILFLGGIQMLMLGFVGLYVGAIFREIKDRPQYLLNDVIKG